jgi:glutamate N-acetyltransferase/amino-acid N-acetyltransferase
MRAVGRAIRSAAKNLSASRGSAAAQAILDNDSDRKEFAVRMRIDGRAVTVGGMAQGTHVVHPAGSSLLCVVTTDALIDKITLKKCLEEAAEKSFLRLCANGLASPCDALVVLASGQARNNILKSYHRQLDHFQKALTLVMTELAKKVVADGAGVSKVVELAVKGARSNVEARAAAASIAHSLKVKAAWNAGEPDWGGIMSAIGGSAARVREELVEIYYNGLLAAANGQMSRTPGSRLKRVLRRSRFNLTVHLHSGQGECNLCTTDLNRHLIDASRR